MFWRMTGLFGLEGPDSEPDRSGAEMPQLINAAVKVGVRDELWRKW